MCCVIPPASVATTRALRIASSSVVLPWSTWPMIVTTGGRACRASSGSSNACERSRTLTPDSTETGPVGGAAGGRGSRRWLSWRAWRCSREGRCPPWSMTTRRRRPAGPPPPRGRSGRFGLLPPLAIGHTSVKAAQLGADAHLLPQDAGEHAALRRAFEAVEAPTRVGASPRLVSAGHQDAIAGRETVQV